MKEVYRIVGICLGIPPQTFTWEYVDKTKQVSSILEIFSNILRLFGQLKNLVQIENLRFNFYPAVVSSATLLKLIEL